jgi:hypothetical protein
MRPAPVDLPANRQRLLASVAVIVAGCDALVGLTPPRQSDGAAADGGGATDAATETSLESSSDTTPALVSSDPGVHVTGLAIAGQSLYVVEHTDESGALAELSYTSLGTYPYIAALSPRFPGSGFTTITALATHSSFVYFATTFNGPGGGSNEILLVDASMDGIPNVTPPPAVVVVDVSAAFPAAPLGAVDSIASDGSSIFWTQVVGSTSALLRHDLDAEATSATVLLVASSGDAFESVAVDDSGVYVLDSGGSVLAVPKQGADAGAVRTLATTALPSVSISARDGEVYFVQATTLGAAGGALMHVPTSGASPPSGPLAADSVGPFTPDGCWIYLGSGANVEFLAPGQGLLQPAAHGLDSDVAGVAAGSGYFAFYTKTAVELVPEPAQCVDGGANLPGAVCRSCAELNHSCEPNGDACASDLDCGNCSTPDYCTASLRCFGVSTPPPPQTDAGGACAGADGSCGSMP